MKEVLQRINGRSKLVGPIRKRAANRSFTSRKGKFEGREKEEGMISDVFEDGAKFQSLRDAARRE